MSERADKCRAACGTIICRTGSSPNPTYTGVDPVYVADSQDKQLIEVEEKANGKDS